MAIVEFDKINKRLRVTSLGNICKSPPVDSSVIEFKITSSGIIKI